MTTAAVDLTVTCHHVGTILRGMTASFPPGVTVLTGPSGCGTSTVLALMGGLARPHVRRVSGRVRVAGVNPLTHNRAELGEIVTCVRAGTRPTGTLRQRLSRRSRLADEIETMGLTEWLDTDPGRLPDDVAGRAGLALALARRPTVLLVDQILADQPARWCPVVAERLEAAGAEGATVVWAEHRLDHAVPVSTQVVDLVNGQAHATPTDQWHPENQPDTILRALARRAGIVPDNGDDVAGLARRLRREGVTVLSRGGTHWVHDEPYGELDLAAAGLRGEPVPVSAGETVAVVSEDPDAAVRAARSLVPRGRRRLDDRRLDALVRMSTVKRVARRRRGQPGCLGDIRSLVGAVGGRTGAEHSDGERRLIAAVPGMLRGPVGLLVEPTRGVDAGRAVALEQMLRRPREHAVLLASRDIEFVVRAADRILLLDGNRIVADGAPTAVVDRLVDAPLVHQVLPETRAVRVREVSVARGGRARREAR